MEGPRDLEDRSLARLPDGRHLPRAADHARAPRRAARPHLSQVEREALGAIRAGATHTGGTIGRKSLAAALYGHPNPPLASSERMQEAVDRLASLGLITIEPTRAGPVFRAVKEDA